MTTSIQHHNLTPEEKIQFAAEGYFIRKALLNQEEVEGLRDLFMQMQAEKPASACFETAPLSVEEAGDEPLKMYPRMIHPHRYNEYIKSYMLDSRLMGILADLFMEEPLAAQSMVYYKPPGARGQALHQDNYYLSVEPGTCIAAWVAIDRADEENGGLVIVPQTQDLEIECPHEADSKASYFRDEVYVPDGKQIIPTQLESGDVLFFNGSTIHGSYPNRSARFRRSLIFHYVGASTAMIGGDRGEDLYNQMGEIVNRDKNQGDGPCGVPFERDVH
jgi:phytanoyl-CoA hydroxylase